MLKQIMMAANFHKQRGLTTVEYAIAGALVGVAVIAAFLLLGPAIGTVINDITTALGG